MKMSISLPEEDVAFVDEYGRRAGLQSRSSVLHRAIDLLRESEMESEYAAAWDEWQGSDDAAIWDSAVGDGVTDAAR